MNGQSIMRQYLPILLIPIFVILFYHQIPGYNVFIFTVLYLVFDIVIFKDASQEVWFHRIVLCLASLMVSLHNTAISGWITALSYALLATSHTGMMGKNYFWQWLGFPILWVQRIFKSRQILPVTPHKSGKRVLINAAIISGALFVFLILYANGSELVARAIGPIFEQITRWLSEWLRHIDFTLIFTLILGFILVVHLIPIEFDFPFEFNTKAGAEGKILPGFYRTAFIFLSAAILMLAWVIALEIQFVWTGFSWKGQLLKGFVHEGTYMLIIAVLVSVAVVMFLFSNLNQTTIPEKIWLKRLMFTWLFLNFLLVISVGVRTGYYIEFFGLAYKRIGLCFFLILCTVILLLTAILIHKNHSLSFLINHSFKSAYILLLLMSFFNWDIIIAKHNISHYRTAYIYLPFLKNLGDETLPYLQQNREQILEMHAAQKQRFPFVTLNEFEQYQYETNIQLRTGNFIRTYQNRGFLSRNFDEDRAFAKLSSTD